MKISNFLAYRYLKSKKETKVLSFISLISIIGIVLGVATLIVVINVMIGFEDNLKQKILGANSHIIVNKIDGSAIDNWKETAEEIAKTDNVVGVSPFIISQVLLTSKERVSGVVLRGVIGKREIESSNIGKYMKRGNFDLKSDNATAKPPIILGKALANSLSTSIGEEIVVVSPFGKKGPFGFTPKMKKFRVAGIFDTGMYEYNNSLAYVNLHDIQNFMKMGDNVSGFSVKVKNFDNAGEIAEKIENKLGFPFWARDWLSMNQNLFSALKLEKAAMFVILTLIIVVASFNVISLITMTVKDKKRDIAIIRAMGASEKLIKNIFIKQGLYIGVVGTVFGNIIAYVICFVLKRYKLIELPADVYYMDSIPIKIVPEVFLLVTVCAIFITFISSIIPARQAAKMDPIEALRNE
ncbi:lipoprotein releasing system, transmembrane protein, LolC/E family [Flexistipes sinusarabici DSM 4947]|uniref:Lipoprotein releasing system, transmembrane protein, LolC/E family n=1 Tax=Flexistipes sinusarabici (strain ATCC 49648 / DSM 4947 / MAS 10) TaxID=717231 RepID=F8E3U2_FLESM|nr:lipoprotein-releasing ABC transporter permease subunit [Flexistipes sinusarabici]AEI15444.1 lipoprotein releasing system, transmembrane protein, LolC/E family [Flexistipes sinusarabici DSM 4947]